MLHSQICLVVSKINNVIREKYEILIYVSFPNWNVAQLLDEVGLKCDGSVAKTHILSK